MVEKVHKLVAEGITDVREIKRALKQYVNRILYPDSTNRPDETNRAYFPTMKDIKNHVYSAKKALELSKFDQHNLKLKINQWEKEKPTSKFHFRPFEEKENSSSPGGEEQQIGSQGLLYVHQEQWQQQLLNRYGNTIVLMDATYKTTKYELPLFF